MGEARTQVVRQPGRENMGNTSVRASGVGEESRVPFEEGGSPKPKIKPERRLLIALS
jgi:hypothetical protein